MARAQWIGLGLAAALAVALTAGLVFAILTITRPSDQRAAATPIVAATASPSPVQSVADIFSTRTPTPQLGPAPTATSPSAERMQIGNTDGEGANLRSEPSQTGTRIKTEAEGTAVDIIGPDRDSEGRTWRNVRDPQGDTGWVQASLLVAVGSAPQIVARPSSSSLTPSAATTPGVAAAAATPIPRATSGGSGRGQIGNTSGQGANIRSEPGGSVLKTLAEGAPIEVLGPERVVNGTTWRQVRDSAGVTGWIVAGAVVPPGTLPTPAAPAVIQPTATGGAPSGGATSGPTTTPRPSAPAPTPSGPTATPNPNLPVIIQPATPLPKPRGSPTSR